MEVQLPNDLQIRLLQLAQRQGRDSGALIEEAVERLVNYDEWFVSEVETGLAQVANGQTLSHEAVGARLDAYLHSRQTRA